ncbi:MAG: TAXI family TRAP transporter solute-binding subunit [Syntrophobacterales bacterium]|nr:TAXI family TRAP transporter solute-binding subunit [Syntrophobacterales bacterium]
MKRSLVPIFTAFLVLGTSLMHAKAEEKNINLIIATGGLGGVYYYYGTAVSEILSQKAGIKATAIQTAASIDNILLIQKKSDPSAGNFYCGTVLPDSAYLAFTGKHEKFKDTPAKELRMLWAMYPNFLHIVTKSDSGIKTLADLKGKRVSTGAPNSGTEVEALLVIEAAGISTKDFSKHERLGAAESAEALAAGTIDAYFWSGGLPTSSITELSTTLSRKGAKMEFVVLSPEDPVVKKLLNDFPGVMEANIIPKDVYGTEKDIPTLAFWNLFLCSASLPEQTAYTMTKTLFENLKQLQDGVKAAKDTTIQNTVKFTKGIIPTHDGAMKYFKEIGVVK